MRVLAPATILDGLESHMGRELDTSTNLVAEVYNFVNNGGLCCIRKRKTAEQREYEDLRTKLANKQEEVRRLQQQCDELNGARQQSTQNPFSQHSPQR